MILQKLSLLVCVLVSAGHAATPPQSGIVPGEYLVKLRAGAGLDSHLGKSLRASFGVESWKPMVNQPGWVRVKISSQTNAGAHAVTLLKKSDEVEIFEPNTYIELDGFSTVPAVPNDIRFQELWGLSNSGQADLAVVVGQMGADIHVASVWGQGSVGDRGILVAVLDTGIEWNHPDLVENIYTNALEAMTPNDGIDNDGNGYVDDVHGWNFSENTNDSTDVYGHGTHVAGTIGGSGNNLMGVTGVNWAVSLMPLRISSADGRISVAGAVEAIGYAKKMGVKVISASWGTYQESQAFKEAIAGLKEAGILYIASAGNSGEDLNETKRFPASWASEYDNLIVVAATNNLDEITEYSNFGNTAVHIAAPGDEILSTRPALKGSYDFLSGTSMATPHVSGAAALLYSMNPKSTYLEIKKRLLQGVNPLKSLDGKISTGGRLNLEKAVAL